MPVANWASEPMQKENLKKKNWLMLNFLVACISPFIPYFSSSSKVATKHYIVNFVSADEQGTTTGDKDEVDIGKTDDIYGEANAQIIYEVLIV